MNSIIYKIYIYIHKFKEKIETETKQKNITILYAYIRLFNSEFFCEENSYFY